MKISSLSSPESIADAQQDDTQTFLNTYIHYQTTYQMMSRKECKEMMRGDTNLKIVKQLIAGVGGCFKFHVR